MRYIYRLFVGYHKKNDIPYEFIFCENYFTREDAIKNGTKNIKDTIESYCDSIEDFLNNYDYEFYIHITDLKRLEFKDISERIKYIKENEPIDTSKIYEFLVQTAEEVYEVYDYNGNLIKGVINPWEHHISYKSTFKPIKLKEEDLVKKVGYNKIYKVVSLYSDNKYNDTVFIESNGIEEEYSETELIKIDKE